MTAPSRRWPLALLLVVACDGSPSSTQPTASPEPPPPDRARDEVSDASTGDSRAGPEGALVDEDGTQTLAELEARLLAAAPMNVTFAVTSSGAFSADVRGDLRTFHDVDVSLEARGTFGEEEFFRVFSADGAEVFLGHQDETKGIGPAPREGRSHQEALVIGLTRMGVLHNVARLMAMKQPDHYDADPREWVQADQVRLGPVQDHESQQLRPLSFHIVVAGQPSGEATLWLDPATGLPVLRDQTVDFGEGQIMIVRESYSWQLGDD